MDSDSCLALRLGHTASPRSLLALSLQPYSRRGFCSSTWLPGLAVTAPCISSPLSCRPTGLWSEFPFVASHVYYNQGTKLGGCPRSDLSCFVSHGRRGCCVTSPSSSQGPLVHWGRAGLSLFFICSMGQLSSAFFPPFSLPF